MLGLLRSLFVGAGREEFARVAEKANSFFFNLLFYFLSFSFSTREQITAAQEKGIALNRVT
jgi:hypothetical protein